MLPVVARERETRGRAPFNPNSVGSSCLVCTTRPGRMLGGATIHRMAQQLGLALPVVVSAITQLPSSACRPAPRSEAELSATALSDAASSSSPQPPAASHPPSPQGPAAGMDASLSASPASPPPGGLDLEPLPVSTPQHASGGGAPSEPGLAPPPLVCEISPVLREVSQPPAADCDSPGPTHHAASSDEHAAQDARAAGSRTEGQSSISEANEGDDELARLQAELQVLESEGYGSPSPPAVRHAAELSPDSPDHHTSLHASGADPLAGDAEELPELCASLGASAAADMLKLSVSQPDDDPGGHQHEVYSASEGGLSFPRYFVWFCQGLVCHILPPVGTVTAAQIGPVVRRASRSPTPEPAALPASASTPGNPDAVASASPLLSESSQVPVSTPEEVLSTVSWRQVQSVPVTHSISPKRRPAADDAASVKQEAKKESSSLQLGSDDPAPPVPSAPQSSATADHSAGSRCLSGPPVVLLASCNTTWEAALAMSGISITLCDYV